VIYSEAFQWKTRPDTLCEFFWRLYFLSLPDIPHSHPFVDSQRNVLRVCPIFSFSPTPERMSTVLHRSGRRVIRDCSINSASHPDCTISSLHSVMSLISSFLQYSELCVGVVPALPIFNARIHIVNVLTATLDQTLTFGHGSTST
jgi:hypothetical protein